ncbi:hypothetical protein PR202_ga07650 [Eleusine coracana subsp. coracana]|uniref:glutathione transferase n=1 Tax=Eleusine coracana subsp. coracana TaxID=191504 RepID=A0AAV5BY30_ELECO|nr:hypothetical protein PR202_ga07650 [Eleusine coracana subsp. coracana]
MERGGDDLKLLGTWASPFVIRVKLALSFKGQSYENIEEEDLYNRKSELLLKSNPVHKKVPVLIHNGRPVCESQLIVQYIDESFNNTGHSLLPMDPYERATSRFWAAYIDDKLCHLSPHGILVYTLVFAFLNGVWSNLLIDASHMLQLFASVFQGGKAKSEEEKAKALKQTYTAVETLELAFREYSKGKPFFGGDSVGYLDIILGGMIPVVHYIEAHYGIKLFDSTRSPLLKSWMECFGTLDATKSVLPSVESLIEYSKMKQARAAASAATN